MHTTFQPFLIRKMSLSKIVHRLLPANYSISMNLGVVSEWDRLRIGSTEVRAKSETEADRREQIQPIECLY